MEINEFENELNKYDIDVTKKQIEKLYEFMKMTLDWNEKVNLTAITDEKEFILKHIVDSLSIKSYIKDDVKVIDVGTGGGFPGMVLAITCEKTKFILLDSLNKRINILNEEIEKLELTNVVAIHGRAEEIGQNKDYREQFDIAVSRAVANMSTLSEYLLPFVKVGGKAICMKGDNYEEELEASKSAIAILGGTVGEAISFPIKDTNHTIIEILKVKNTPKNYPRKAGTPAKIPLA